MIIFRIKTLGCAHMSPQSMEAPEATPTPQYFH